MVTEIEKKMQLNNEATLIKFDIYACDYLHVTTLPFQMNFIYFRRSCSDVAVFINYLEKYGVLLTMWGQ
jgi:hypothetical protein